MNILWTFLIGMLPIGEARAAIPFGVFYLGLAPFEAFFYAVLGNLTATFLVFFLLEPCTNLLQRFIPVLHKFLQKIFHLTRRKHSQRFKRFEEFFLFFFVSVPWPGSGGYTGAILAWLFNVPLRVAMLVLAGGVITSGLLVLGVTVGLFQGWNLGLGIWF